jgi:hypothetical protein
MIVRPRQQAQLGTPDLPTRAPRRRHQLTWIAMILAGCSDGVLDPSEPVVASLGIVDAPAALLVADTVRLTLVAMDSSGTAITPTVTWTASNGAVASVREPQPFVSRPARCPTASASRSPKGSALPHWSAESTIPVV